MVEFWNSIGYENTIRIKDISVCILMLLAGMILGGFFTVRFYQNLMHSSAIDKLGTVKFHGNIVSDPKSTWETIDTLTAIITIRFFPKRVVQPRNIRRAKIIGRVLWGLAIFLILFGIIMSNSVMLDPYKGYVPNTD